MSLPDFVIFGAQKAGSTFLLEALRAHSDIFMPREELAFFEDSLYDPQELQQFERHFDEAKPNQRTGFKRPNLLGHPESAGRMKHDLGSTLQLIAILRNPVERAVSAYFHAAATGIIPPQPIEVGLPDILKGKFAHPRAEEILTFGLYHQHLNEFEKQFAKDCFCVVLLDELKTDLKSVFARLCQFLNIDTNFPLPEAGRRPMAAPYSMRRIRIKRTLEAPARKWTEDGQYFDFKKGWLWKYYLKGIRGIDRVILKNIFSDSAPRLSDNLHQQLVDYYTPDTTALSSHLNRNLGHWLTRTK